MDALTKSAVRATLHCLAGCAIGEVLGMVIGTALGWHGFATIMLAIVLAFFFGYMLSLMPVRRAGVPLRKALFVALAADTVSITTMEIIDNLTIVIIPGALDAMLSDALFWVSLSLSLLFAFIITVPVNRYLIARGKGHALAHKYHHHHQ